MKNPFIVEYWPARKGYGSVKRRKFTTREKAFEFVSDKVDNGYETQVFEPGSNVPNTWNGSSAF